MAMSMIDDTDDTDARLLDEPITDESFFEVDESAPADTEAEKTPPATPDASPPDTGTPASEDDKEAYGKRVQKRINKLTLEKRHLETQVRAMQSRLDDFEAKYQAREISEFQRQAAQSEQQLKDQLATTQQTYRRAVEEGDIDAQMTAMDDMFALRDQLADKKRLADAAREQAEQLKAAPSQRTDTAPAPAPTQAPIPDNLPEGTRQWLQANKWYMTESDPKAAQYARQLDADLQEEGYSPDDPAMYEELDRRLHAVLPRLATGNRKPASTPAAAKSQSAPRTKPTAYTAGSTPDGQGPTVEKTPSRKLTSDDLSLMRKYGFDPNRVEHRKAWIMRNDPL